MTKEEVDARLLLNENGDLVVMGQGAWVSMETKIPAEQLDFWQEKSKALRVGLNGGSR